VALLAVPVCARFCEALEASFEAVGHVVVAQRAAAGRQEPPCGCLPSHALTIGGRNPYLNVMRLDVRHSSLEGCPVSV